MRQNRKKANSISRAVGFLGICASVLLCKPAAGATDYPELVRSYYLDRSVEFAQELLLKEEYLGALYQCAVQELKARRKEGLSPSVLASPLWELKPAEFQRDGDDGAEFTVQQRYQKWVEFENAEYQRRLTLIQNIRQNLIRDGSAAQKERFFQSELKKAMDAYGRSEWDLARLLFDRLIEDYGYRTIDDILYYQGETCLQLRLHDKALQYYLQLINTAPDSRYRARSYDRATAILQAFGNGREIRRLYARYVEEGMPGDPAEMGGVHIRAARAEIDLGHFEPAIAQLERIDRQSSYYLASRYLLADCYAALENWPAAVDVLTGMVGTKKKNMAYDRWRLLVDEARIKLAFIYYKWGDYDSALKYFNQVKSNSPFYDRVILGKAWISFKVDDFDATIAGTEELLKLYPRSSEIYEAGSLAGYCYEQLGDKENAVTHFLEVLNAGVGRTQLQSFFEERRRIAESMADLRACEADVFASGDEKLFADYKRARNTLWICQQRIGLAELLQVNARMRGLVEERVALDSLIREHARLEDQVRNAQNARLISDFLLLDQRIYDIMDHLKAAGQEQLKATPLYYKEALIGYINARADSLSKHVDAEIATLTAAIRNTSDLQSAALAEQQPQEVQSLGMKLDHLNGLLNQSYVQQTEAKASKRPILATRVDRWSDFSFYRYAMGGMELEELDRKYDRLRQVEEYLSTLDELIERRSGESAPPGSTGSNP
jgi:tetratricopeptide (TPR) repeat protein